MVAAGKFRPLELRMSGETVATVDYDQSRGSYYWYGGIGEKRHNSLWAGITYATPEVAKQAAKEAIQALLS